MAILRMAQTVAPVLEPVTLLEAKNHMRVDSGDIADDTTVSQTVVPDEYTPTTGTNGTPVDVANSKTLMIVNAGTVVGSGKLDIKMQEADSTGGIWNDVEDGSFTQITVANDNATFELEYTGSKQYLRSHHVLATANATFTVNITEQAPTAVDDTLITTLITVARQHVERITNLSLINQTRTFYMDNFPNSNEIWLPRPPFSSTSGLAIEYTGSGETTAYDNAVSTSTYSADTISKPGRLILRDGYTWPSASLETNNPIRVTYLAGYGSNRSSVPEPLKQAILITIDELYENREDTVFNLNVGQIGWLNRLLAPYKNWWPM